MSNMGSTGKVAGSPNETDKEFVVRLHNEGKRNEEIALQYAKDRHGRASPNEADKRFVDGALANLEG